MHDGRIATNEYRPRRIYAERCAKSMKQKECHISKRGDLTSPLFFTTSEAVFGDSRIWTLWQWDSR